MILTFRNWKGLKKGPNSVRVQSVLLIIAAFFIGSFVASALANSFAPAIDNSVLAYIGGSVAAILKLSL